MCTVPPPLETICVSGKSYLDISKKIYSGKKGSFDLAEIKNWYQPINFLPQSDILAQTHAGPCAIFAVIQANILKYRKKLETCQREKRVLLFQSICDIMSILGDKYAFCVDIDSKKQVATMKIANSYEIAVQWLFESQYNIGGRCIMFLMFSFIYLIQKKDWFYTDNTPFIRQDKMSSMGLVWLLLTGSYSMDCTSAQSDIGVKVVANPNKELNGTYLNPTALVHVCHSSAHFYTIVKNSDNTVSLFNNLTRKPTPTILDNSDLISI